MRDFWTRSLTNNHRFTKANSDYRRIVLLNFALVMTTLFMLVYGLFNIIVNADYLLAAVQLAGMVIGISIIVYFKLSNNITVTSILFTSIFLIILTMIIFVDAEGDYTLMWILLVQAISYFVLGRIPGSVITGLYTLFIIAFMLWIAPAIGGPTYDINNFFNVIGSIVAVGFIIRYFEFSRTETLEELMKLNDHLRLMSETDKLTLMYNRLKLDDVLEAEIMAAETSLKPLSILMIDIDDFKSINDEYGHLQGDSVLVQAAFLLKKNVKEPCVIGRWGGEEFLVICRHRDIQAATDLGQQLAEVIDRAIFDDKVRFTVSIGVTGWVPGDTTESIIKRADLALYESKKKGKNLVTYNE